MASGTPLVTTHLPGMPDEYVEHVYLFEDETIEGMKNTLDSLLSNDSGTLHSKGTKAKKFVTKYKNHKSQAKKVCDLMGLILK